MSVPTSSAVALLVFIARLTAAQSAPATPWVEADFEISALRAPQPYMDAVVPSFAVGVAVPVAAHTLVALHAEEGLSVGEEIACASTQVVGGSACPTTDRPFSITGVSASLITNRPHRFPSVSSSVGLGAYSLRWHYGHSPFALGIPLGLAIPLVPDGVRSMQLIAHTLVIPRVGHSTVLSFGAGFSFRGRILAD